MKKKLLDLQGNYQSPVVTEETISSEDILCASGSIEKFDFIEDVDGWLSEEN